MTIMTKEQVFDLLRSSLTSSGRSENTIRAYEADMASFYEWVIDHLEPGVDPTTGTLSGRYATAYINDQRTKHPASTVTRRMAAIRCWHKMNGRPDPFADYIAPKRFRAPAHPLPGLRDDIDAMLSRCKTNEQRCIVALCSMCGARISEARAVRVSDLSVVAGARYVRLHGKGDKDRMVPVPDSAWVHIEARIAELRGGHKRGDRLVPTDPKLINYSDRGARQIINNFGAASHDLRMTFGTMVYGASGDIRATQELLGHANVETTVGYIGVRDKAMIDAVKGAFA